MPAVWDSVRLVLYLFFFNDTPTTEIYTLSLHDALPICSHSPARSAWQARCSATSAEEHAVSTVTAGPSRPSAYATRPVTTLPALPVIRYTPAPSPPPAIAAAYPEVEAPANTPVLEPRSDAGSIP